MASGTIGAEEQQQPPKEKHRWSENSKVYTRKFYKGSKNNLNNPNPITITTTSLTNNQTNDTSAATTNKVDKPVENVENPKNNDNHVAVNGIMSNDNKDEGNENNKESESNKKNENNNEGTLQESSPPKMPTEEANSSQLQQNSPRVETIFEDSLSHHRQERPVSIGHDPNLTNGLVRPVVTQVDDRLNISVSAASSKQEVRDLKRKLEVELDQVRKMAKKLEAKEVQLNSYASGGVGLGVTTGHAVGSLQFPVNGGLEKGLGVGSGGMRVNLDRGAVRAHSDMGGMRANSDMGSVGYSDSRSFRQLSVSVMDNNHGLSEVVEKEKRTPKANQYYRNSEFLLGKERLPPTESNKKSKSTGIKKHGNREFDYGFGIDKQLFKSCSNLLQRLMKHKHGWVFNHPVDVKRLGLHDYFDIIKHPMDLGTVKTRLTKNWYKTPREFAEDVRLTFHNAMTYNPEGQDVHIMAKELLRIFEEKWPAIETEYDRKLRYEMIRDLGVPTPTSRKSYAPIHVPAPMPLAPPPFLHQPPPFQDGRHLARSQSMPVPQEARSRPVYSMGRTPAPKKPKAKDPHKRDMTFEEKQRLSTNLQGLPSEKLDAIVQIIKKRNSALSQHNDEIEVDIDSVDAETLWELDRFVTNCKKSLSKIKRKAEVAQARAAAAAAAQAAQQTIPAPTNVEATKETRTDEGNVATSPHAQQEKQQSDNDSGSSSSSSSSSHSGSSSSDSDSDSSSGYGSEGGH